MYYFTRHINFYIATLENGQIIHTCLRQTGLGYLDGFEY